AGDEDGGIVDEDIDAAELLLGPGDDFLPALLGGDVVLDEQRVVTDLGGDGVAVLLVEIGEHDPGALLHQQGGVALADAAGAARHDCHLARSSSHRSFLSVGSARERRFSWVDRGGRSLLRPSSLISQSRHTWYCTRPSRTRQSRTWPPTVRS